jgi:hypothetical protein
MLLQNKNAVIYLRLVYSKVRIRHATTVSA